MIQALNEYRDNWYKTIGVEPPTEPICNSIDEFKRRWREMIGDTAIDC